jgi:hypothetical protein
MVAAFHSRIPLLSNRFFWWDCAKALGVALTVVAAVIVGVLAHGAELARLPSILPFLGLALAVVLGLIASACLVFFPRGYSIRFRLDDTGVLWQSRSEGSGSRQAEVSSVHVEAAAPRVAGSTLLARSTNTGRFPWPMVRAIHFHPSTGVLCFLNSWRVVVRVYCPPYAYHAAADAARFYSSAYAKEPIRLVDD